MQTSTELLDAAFPGTTLTSYVHQVSSACPHPPRPAMLVLPGGGYEGCYDGEAEPIALAYVAAGYNAYVLRYGVGENARFPRPLREAAWAMHRIRARAADENTDAGRVFAIGFSAGAHLCGALATLWHRTDLLAPLPCPAEECRPTGVLLSYPVVTGGEYRHAGSFCHLLGRDDPSPEELALYSNEKNVDGHTCPAFLFHTADDNCVPVQNSLLMAGALAAHYIPFELHVYAHGPHGVGLATEESAGGRPGMVLPAVATWFSLSLTWLSGL